jgi:glutathione synthase
MKIAFLLYPTISVKVDEDSSFWIMHELARRGHEVFHFESNDLFWADGRVRASLSVSQMKPRHGFTLTTKHPSSSALDRMDVIFIRKEPPFDNEYLYALQILSLLERHVFVLNDPTGIAMCNEKLFIAEFKEFIPQSLVSGRPDELTKFIRSLGSKVVVKPLDNKGGSGIFITRAKDRNLPSLLEQLTKYGSQKVMAQRYIPHDRQGDKRILLLEGEPLGCFARIPPKADFRANLSVGGSMRKAVLSKRDKKILRALKPKLLEKGLYFVGIDVIDGYLSEINVTSPSGIPEIKRLTGQRLEKDVADFIERSRRQFPDRRRFAR